MTTIFIIHPDEQHSHYLASALHSLGYDTRLVTGRDMSQGLIRSIRRSKDLSEYQVVELMPSLYLIAGLIRKLFKGTFFARLVYKKYLSAFNMRALSEIKKIRPDAIVTYDTLSGELIEGVLAYISIPPEILVDMSGPAYSSYLFNSYDPDPKREFRYDLECDAWRFTNSIIEVKRANAFIVASTYTAQGLLSLGVSESKIHICPYGNKLKNDTRIEDVKHVSYKDKIIKMLFVGNVSMQKGVHKLLSAVSRINLSTAPYKINLTLVGDPRFFDNSVNRYPWLTMTGRLNRDQVKEAYQNNVAFVFPSLADGFGFVVLEALSFGIPVLCSKYAGASDLINDVNGEVFDPLNAEDFNDKLEVFIENIVSSRYNSKNVVESVEQYTWETYASSLRPVLESRGLLVE